MCTSVTTSPQQTLLPVLPIHLEILLPLSCSMYLDTMPPICDMATTLVHKCLHVVQHIVQKPYQHNHGKELVMKGGGSAYSKKLTVALRKSNEL